MKISKEEARKLGVPPAHIHRKAKKQKVVPVTGVFEALCKKHGLPEPVAEYQFAPPRKWRADWCFAEMDVLVEIEGGSWTNGRHTRGLGFEADIVKYAEATCRGWFILRVTPQMVEDGRLFEWLTRICRGEG